MDNERRYYEQQELWNEVAEYQRNVLKDICAVIPAEVGTILDVGCGNGFVVNTLSRQYDCVGVDLSETALKTVCCRKQVASATDLPFADGEFDLVMANDVLEHLPHGELARAIAEIRRVAAKYILVTVPFMENLGAGMTKCANCGSVYHISHHVNSFGTKELMELFPKDEVHPVCFAYSGSDLVKADLVQYEVRGRLGLYTEWRKAMCPVCGKCASSSFYSTSQVSPFCSMMQEIGSSLPVSLPMRNECIVLFSKERVANSGPDYVTRRKDDGFAFRYQGIEHLLPRSAVVPEWFNALAVCSLSSNVRNDDVPLKYALARMARATDAIDELQSAVDELRRRNERLSQELDECRNRIGVVRRLYRKILTSWVSYRRGIEDLALPNVHGNQLNAGVGCRHFTVICHDQDIDRRILQQVESLCADGWKGWIVCLSFDNEDHIEEGIGCSLHRIGLKHIVPMCRCFWLYQGMRFWAMKLLARFGRLQQLALKGAFAAYRAMLALHYRCRPIKHPLPFDAAFVAAGKFYKADLILAEDLPALKAGALLKKEWDAALVFDSHEFYPEQRVFSRVQKRIMHDVAKQYLPACDEVITVSDGIAELFSSFYGVKKPHVIHNVTDLEHVVNGRLFHEKLGIATGQKIVLYQGGIIPDRNIENLVEGFAKASLADAHLVLMGPSAPKFLEALKRRAGRLLGVRIHFMEAVPRAELLKWTASADVGIIPYKVVDLNTKFCMPNKFFEFIQASLPVLSNRLVEVEKVLSAIGGGGLVADLGSPKAVSHALGEMLSRNLDRDREALAAARAELSWQHESKLFADIIRSATGSAIREKCA